MSRPTLELADIFRHHGEAFRLTHPLSIQQQRVMRAVEVCRTAVLGGHVEQCGHCHYQQISYNSCRNRHCPKCQAGARDQWVAARQADLLPIPYFHVVFTLPHQFAPLALQNQKALYNVLFQASAETLLTIAADPKHLGAHIGFFSVLHTWGQNLLLHPHVHCVVTGGGLSLDRRAWRSPRHARFFVSVQVLSALFRRLFLAAFWRAFDAGQLVFHGQRQPLRDRATLQKLLAPIRHAKWVVYAKPPFGGPQRVLDYLGRYTHRIAISNHRLQRWDAPAGQVAFQWKNYRQRDDQALGSMTLGVDEFIRRFLLHTVPPGFQRIRYYGLLTNRYRAAQLSLCRQLLQACQWLPAVQLLPTPALAATPSPSVSARPCPRCQTGVLARIQTLFPITWPRQPDSS
jgi:hypothetical protein